MSGDIFKSMYDSEKLKYQNSKIQKPLSNPIILVNGLSPNLKKFKKPVDKD
jgi:hypothetical protein